MFIHLKVLLSKALPAFPLKAQLPLEEEDLVDSSVPPATAYYRPDLAWAGASGEKVLLRTQRACGAGEHVKDSNEDTA